MELLNGKQLAERMKVSRTFVCAMKNAGYQFSHGSYTTLRHALNWLRKHPEFRTTRYNNKVKDDPTPVLTPDLSVAGKCGGPSSSYD